MDTKLAQAIHHLHNGQRAEARAILKEVLQVNPHNETTWMWMVEALDTPGARLRALEACLRYLPNSKMAQEGLVKFRQELTAGTHLPPPASLYAGHLPAKAFPAAQPHRRTFSLESFLLTLLVISLLGVGILAFLAFFPHGPQSVTSDQALDPWPEPVQRKAYYAEPFTIPDNGFEWTITPLAEYEVTARVLGKRSYTHEFWDQRAKLSPYDLALGWGALSDQAVDQWITWEQQGRWYYYYWTEDSPYDGWEIGAQSANTHVIPASTNILSALDKVKNNDLIYLEGYLVNVSATIGDYTWRANTSLSRTDSGDGACEQLYVARMIWNGQAYR
ncbi:MAG: hypothetical protein ACOYYS_28025 [Chloroflexota bacterium]